MHDTVIQIRNAATVAHGFISFGRLQHYNFLGDPSGSSWGRASLDHPLEEVGYGRRLCELLGADVVRVPEFTYELLDALLDFVL